MVCTVNGGQIDIPLIISISSIRITIGICAKIPVINLLKQLREPNERYQSFYRSRISTEGQKIMIHVEAPATIVVTSAMIAGSSYIITYKQILAKCFNVEHHSEKPVWDSVFNSWRTSIAMSCASANILARKIYQA